MKPSLLCGRSRGGISSTAYVDVSMEYLVLVDASIIFQVCFEAGVGTEDVEMHLS